MNQLSLRGFEPELQREIEELSRSKGISLNKAALLLLRKGAGIAGTKAPQDVVGSSLDHLIGRWTRREEKQFLKAVRLFDKVDEEFRS